MYQPDHTVEHYGAYEGEPGHTQSSLDDALFPEVQERQGDHYHGEEEHAEAVGGEAWGVAWRGELVEVGLVAHIERTKLERQVCGPGGASHSAIRPQGREDGYGEDDGVEVLEPAAHKELTELRLFELPVSVQPEVGTRWGQHGGGAGRVGSEC